MNKEKIACILSSSVVESEGYETEKSTINEMMLNFVIKTLSEGGKYFDKQDIILNMTSMNKTSFWWIQNGFEHNEYKQLNFNKKNYYKKSFFDYCKEHYYVICIGVSSIVLVSRFLIKKINAKKNNKKLK